MTVKGTCKNKITVKRSDFVRVMESKKKKKKQKTSVLRTLRFSWNENGAVEL